MAWNTRCYMNFRRVIPLIFACCLLWAFVQRNTDEDLAVRLTSNYGHLLSMDDIRNVNCEDVIVLRGDVSEAYVGKVKGAKECYFKWVLERNGQRIQQKEGELFRLDGGYSPTQKIFFHVFPYEGVYEVRLELYGYNKKGDVFVKDVQSNQILVRQDFVPKLMGGSDKQGTRYFQSSHEMVLDCSTAHCVQEFFIVVSENDEEGKPVRECFSKVFKGDVQEFISLFTLARQEEFSFENGKNYHLKVGPGANAKIDPDLWFINQEFVVE